MNFRYLLLVPIASCAALDGAAATQPMFVPRPAAPFLFTPLNERSAAFSPDGRTVLFTLRLGDGYRQEMFVSTRGKAGWSKPQTAPFSGRFFDADPSFSPDGRTVFFATTRGADGKERADLDIWEVSFDGSRWGEPHAVSGKVNSPANDSSPVLTPSGRLYFASSRSAAGDLFVSDPGPERFGDPRSLGPGVNSPASEVSLAVSQDEQTLVFAAVGRDDETFARGHLYARGDLYVSHWTTDGWGNARKLPPPINSAATESGPAFSSDGKRFYFMSERGFALEQGVRLTPEALARGLAGPLNGRGNIYVVDARALETDR